MLFGFSSLMSCFRVLKRLIYLRLLFHRYLRNEVWALRRSGDRVVTVEPDAAVLAATRLTMMDGRRIDQIEQRAYELAGSRLAGAGKSVGGSG